MIRQVDLAWISLGVVDERHERPHGDPVLRVDRIRREVEQEIARRQRDGEATDAQSSQHRVGGNPSSSPP